MPAPVADDVDGTLSGGVRQPSLELGGAGRLDRSVTVTADSRRVVDRTEFVVFLVAVGLVALHVVDDNFLQPQLGTSQTDHLFSGLVPLALLLGAAVVYRRARAGVRATLALLFGFFGVLSGTEAVYYSLSGGPSGDDFTGFLSMVGGFVLLGVGVAVLWRSRRTDGSRLRRYARRSAITVGVLLLASQVLFQTAIAYVVTHTARAGVPTPNLGAAYEDVAFVTVTGSSSRAGLCLRRTALRSSPFPGAPGPKNTRACSCVMATASSSSTVAARARAKAIRIPSAGTASETCTLPRRISVAVPMSTPSGSARSASRSVARC